MGNLMTDEGYPKKLKVFRNQIENGFLDELKIKGESDIAIALNECKKLSLTFYD